MQYVFSGHAEERIARRKIRREWVLAIAERPEAAERDETDAQLEHRLGRVVQAGNRVLRVIVNDLAEPERIVTAYFDRKMRNKL